VREADDLTNSMCRMSRKSGNPLSYTGPVTGLSPLNLEVFNDRVACHNFGYPIQVKKGSPVEGSTKKSEYFFPLSPKKETETVSEIFFK
jgi:hypothetical protein